MQGTPTHSEDPFEVGFRIGQQQALQSATMQAETIASMQSIAERQTKHNIVIAQKNDSVPIVRGFLGILIVGTLAFVAIDGLTSVESENTGTASTIIDARSKHSIVVWHGQKVVSGDADHDVLGPSTNPWAYSVGIVERQVEYVPQGGIEVRAVEDPDIGFYLSITESKDGQDIPMDFTNIQVTTPKPEPCPIDIVDSEIRPKNYCTPITDAASRGLISTDAWQGGPFQNDTRITEDGRRALNVAIDNTYCELGLVFGARSVTSAMNGDSSGITEQSIYRGVEASIKATFRLDLSAQYGIPLTDNIGKPYILWPDDVALLKRIASEQRKPLAEFTRNEFFDAVLDATFLKYDNEGSIDPGPTYAEEILDLRDKYEDVNTPLQEPSLTRENAAVSSWNFSCLPKLGTPEADSMKADEETRYRVGTIGPLEPYARTSGDGSVYTAEEAEAMVASFRSRVGI